MAIFFNLKFHTNCNFLQVQIVVNDSDNFMGLLFHKNFIFANEKIIIFGKHIQKNTSVLFPLNIDSKYHSFGTSPQSKKKH